MVSAKNVVSVNTQWPGIPPQTVASTPTSTQAADVPPSTSGPAAAVLAQPVAPVKCNWTEHTSLEGFKYYYNSATRESRVRK